VERAADELSAAPALLPLRTQQASIPSFAPSRASQEHLLRRRMGEG